MTNPYIIAEIASAHEGQPQLALEIARHAARTGADAVKFQIFKRDQLLTKTNPYFDEFGEIEIAPKKWESILKQISNESIDIIIEPYDLESFQLVEQFEFINGYKIAAANTADNGLLEFAIKSGKPLYLGVGGSKWKEIKQVASLLQGTDVTLICGFQNFPTKLEDSKLFQLQQIKDELGYPVGYADHVSADDHEMARMVPTLAVSMGAEVIEKHITNDRSRKGRDHYSALNPEEFISFVRLLRSLPDIIGVEQEWCLSEAEIKYRKFTKKQAVASREIPAGTKLDLIDVAFKRTNEDGLSPQDIYEYVGKKIERSKKADKALYREDFIAK